MRASTKNYTLHGTILRLSRACWVSAGILSVIESCSARGCRLASSRSIGQVNATCFEACLISPYLLRMCSHAALALQHILARAHFGDLGTANTCQGLYAAYSIVGEEKQRQLSALCSSGAGTVPLEPLHTKAKASRGNNGPSTLDGSL